VTEMEGEKTLGEAMFSWRTSSPLANECGLNTVVSFQAESQVRLWIDIDRIKLNLTILKV